MAIVADCSFIRAVWHRAKSLEEHKKEYAAVDAFTVAPLKRLFRETLS
jgi:hypothetical protein